MILTKYTALQIYNVKQSLAKKEMQKTEFFASLLLGDRKKDEERTN